MYQIIQQTDIEARDHLTTQLMFATIGVVVGGQLIGHEFTRSVRKQIVAHVVALRLHVRALSQEETGKPRLRGFKDTTGAIFAHTAARKSRSTYHLVKSTGAHQVALAIHLPGDGRKLRADFIVARHTRGGARVHGNVLAVARTGIDNHTTHQVRVVIGLIVDNGENLSLDANLRGCIRQDTITAKDAIVKRRLPLVHGTTGASGRVRPMHLVL